MFRKSFPVEATSLNALYRDVSGYPEPIRSRIATVLRDYTDQIIHGAWPLMTHGKIPAAGIEYMSRFQAMLITFEPATEGQKILHGRNPPCLQPADPGPAPAT